MSYHYVKTPCGTIDRRFKIENEVDWLHSRGGRTYDDVETDEKGKYVNMYHPVGLQKVYIPTYFN